MMSLAVLLLCAVSGHTLGSTLKPLQEMNMEDAVLSLIKQMSNMEEKILVLEKKEWVEEMRKMKDELLMEIKGELLMKIESSERRFVENKNEIATKLEEVLTRISEIERRSNVAIDDVSDRLQVEKNKLLLMNNHLLAEVLELRKKDLDTFEKIANVESEVRDRVTLIESVEQGKKIQKDLSEEIKRVERNYLEDKNEQSSKLEQVLHKISENEKSSNAAIGDVSDSLQVEKNKLLLMNNNLSAEVLELQKRDLETFGKIANVESELSRDRVRAEMLQVRLNETENKTHSCLASQTQIQETMQKNIERLDLIEESNLSARIGNVENSFKTLRQDLDYVSNRQDDTLKLTVQNNTDDIGQLKQELSRIQTICSPPCENGGQCVNNVCKCGALFYGDRCQDGPKCGVDFDNGGSNGGGNISSDLVWPWMAAVYSSGYHKCSGSVIHRHFVLTAAECVDIYGSTRLSLKLGLSDLKKGTHLQEYRVQSAHMHPQYKGSTYDNFNYNIGLLELEEPISFGPFVRPVCLPPQDIPQDELFYNPQSDAKAVSLNVHISSPQTASLLNLTMLSQEECRRKMKENDIEKFYPSPDLTFCAGIPSTKCPDDESPVMQSRLAEDGTRTWTQIGVTSGCSNKYVRGPRLDRLKAWVDATIEASSKR